MNPYPIAEINAQRRASEPHPVENGYNGLVAEYNNAIKANPNDPSAVVKYWQNRMGPASFNDTFPELSDIWANVKAGQGETLNRSTIESYAQQKTGSVFDWAMAKSFLPQYDDLGAFNLLGDQGVDKDKLAQRIEDADLKEAGLGQASGINSIVNPNGPPTEATTCLPNCDMTALQPQPPQVPCNDSSLSNMLACDNTSGTTSGVVKQPDTTGDPTRPQPNGSDQTSNNATGTASDSSGANCPANSHVIKAGDTLWSIAVGMLNVPNDKAHANQIYKMVQQIAQLNSKYKPDHIPVNARIELPDSNNDNPTGL